MPTAPMQGLYHRWPQLTADSVVADIVVIEPAGCGSSEEGDSIFHHTALVSVLYSVIRGWMLHSPLVLPVLAPTLDAALPVMVRVGDGDLPLQRWDFRRGSLGSLCGTHVR